MDPITKPMPYVPVINRKLMQTLDQIVELPLRISNEMAVLVAHSGIPGVPAAMEKLKDEGFDAEQRESLRSNGAAIAAALAAAAHLVHICPDIFLNIAASINAEHEKYVETYLSGKEDPTQIRAAWHKVTGQVADRDIDVQAMVEAMLRASQENA